jgi:transposase
MKEKLRFLGMDVHAETIAAAIAEPDGEVRSLGTIPNRMESVRKLIRKLGLVEKLRVCYEAGPTGYVLYWQLAELGVQCEVIAPSLVPVVGTRWDLVVKAFMRALATRGSPYNDPKVSTSSLRSP